MGLLSSKEIREIKDAGYFECHAHNFIVDNRDTDAIKKHLEENVHTISGNALCGRCQKEMVDFSRIEKPPEGKQPMVFCPKCEDALVANIEKARAKATAEAEKEGAKK